MDPYQILEEQIKVLEDQQELLSLRSKLIEERDYLQSIDPQTLPESERLLLSKRIRRNNLALKQIVVLNNKIIGRLLN